MRRKIGVFLKQTDIGFMTSSFFLDSFLFRLPPLHAHGIIAPGLPRTKKIMTTDYTDSFKFLLSVSPVISVAKKNKP